MALSKSRSPVVFPFPLPTLEAIPFARRGCLVDGLGDWTTGFTVNTGFSCTFFLGAGKGGGVLGPTVLLF